MLPDVYFVPAWNSKNAIRASNKALLVGDVEFYFPVDPDRAP